MRRGPDDRLRGRRFESGLKDEEAEAPGTLPHSESASERLVRAVDCVCELRWRFL